MAWYDPIADFGKDLAKDIGKSFKNTLGDNFGSIFGMNLAGILNSFVGIENPNQVNASPGTVTIVQPSNDTFEFLKNPVVLAGVGVFLLILVKK